MESKAKRGTEVLESLFETENRLSNNINKTKKLDDELFKTALEKWGKEEQFWMAVEEMGELLSAINQVRRGRIEPLHMMEEIVDVFIMMSQLRYIDPDLFDMIYAFKVKRIRRKLGMEE